MKTRILSIIAVITMSFAVNAQIDRSKMPKPGPDPVVKLGKAEKFSLDNGMTVIMVENHKLPRVSATLTIDNKPYSEGKIAGVSSMMGSLLGRGTKNITKDEFNEKVDFLGANVNFYSSGASARSLKKYFPEVLGLLADGAKNSIFNQEEFEKEKKVTLEGLKSGEKDVKGIARRVENVLVFGKNHPNGEFVNKETVNTISLEDVKNNFNTYYKPNNAYLIIVGDINPKKTKKLVKELFSDWKKGNVPSLEVEKPKNVATTEIDFVNMPNANQSEVVVVNSVDLTLGDKDYYAALIANKILGGGGSARLFNNLREDKAYTYGSYSNIRQSRNTGTFRAYASVRNMVTDSAVVEIQKEINKIRYQKISKKELQDAKEEYIGGFVMDVQKPATAANYALNIALYNLPENFYANYIKNINSVTIEDVQNAAIKHFKGGKARIIITGKGIDVLKNLEKNSDYKINYFDKNGNPTTKPEMTKAIPAGITKTTVINKYLDAIGGADKIKGLKSSMTVYEGSAMGNTIQSTEKRTTTNSSTAISMGGNVMQKVLINKNTVTMNGKQLPPMMADMTKDMAKTLGTFIEVAYLNNPETKLTGIENINGNEVYAITQKGKMVTITSYYDSKTGLKVKEVQVINMGGRTQNQEATFSDYKEFNGVKFATKKSGSMAGQKLNFTLKDAKVNEGVSDADFK